MRTLFAATIAAIALTAAAPAFAQSSRPTFSGGHVEAMVGYDNVHADGEHIDGLMYGIGAGYDFRTRNLVLGIEGEAADSTSHRCIGGTCVDASRDLYIGGRIGAVVAPNVLLYGKAGYTNARFTASSGGLHDSTNLDGIRAGVGVEWAIPHSPVSLRAEYRYSNYQDGVTRNQGVAGLAFRF